MESGSGFPLSVLNMQKSLIKLIDSIAMENSALGKILDLEGDAVKCLEDAEYGLDGFLAVNESVDGLIRSISRLQTITQAELLDVQEMLKMTGDRYDDTEE